MSWKKRGSKLFWIGRKLLRKLSREKKLMLRVKGKENKVMRGKSSSLNLSKQNHTKKSEKKLRTRNQLLLKKVK